MKCTSATLQCNDTPNVRDQNLIEIFEISFVSLLRVNSNLLQMFALWFKPIQPNGVVVVRSFSLHKIRLIDGNNVKGKNGKSHDELRAFVSVCVCVRLARFLSACFTKYAMRWFFIALHCVHTKCNGKCENSIEPNKEDRTNRKRLCGRATRTQIYLILAEKIKVNEKKHNEKKMDCKWYFVWGNVH